MTMNEGKYKVVLLGDGAVGKTSLVKRFVTSEYDEKYLKTLGANVYKKSIKTSGGSRAILATLQIWDVMGQESFKNVVKSSLKGANGAMLVCDLTRKETILSLVDWVKMVLDNTEDVSLVFLANKSDLKDIQFGYNIVKKVADSFYSPFYLTSAKTGDGVNESFKMLTNQIYTMRTVPGIALPPIKEKVKDIPPLIMAEDNIINIFCTSIGGYEKGMPIIRKQFEILGIDFEKPSKPQLHALVVRLSTIMKHKSPENMRQIHSDMKKALKRV